MKRLLAAVVLVLTPIGSLDAATITYEHPFSVQSPDQFEPGFPGSDNKVRHYLGGPYDEWTIPLFDFSLGVPEVLIIEIEGTATISGTFHDLGGLESVNPDAWFAIMAARSSSDEYPPFPFVWFIQGYVPPCTEPCDFSTSTDMASTGYFYPITPDMEPIVLPIGLYGADNFVYWELPASATIRNSINGTARATYIYEPAAIPEPTTLLLLGSGLIAARVRRSRRR